jgi:mxaJ protein
MSSPFRERILRIVAGAGLIAAAIAMVAHTHAFTPRSALAAEGAPAPRELRVCADPRNLPYSNKRGEGFENRLADIVASDLHAHASFTWWAQRRGYIRNTLTAHRCDVLLGIPAQMERVLTTRPYYRSSYVAVSRSEHPLDARSFDDPRLRSARIGVSLIGDDAASTPPAHALGARGLVDNVIGYPVLGDPNRDPPGGAVIDGLMNGEIDLAFVWGPLAGYFAAQRHLPLVITRLDAERDGVFPLVFEMAMAVRREDRALRDELDAALVRHRTEIDALLDEFGVPRS